MRRGGGEGEDRARQQGTRRNKAKRPGGSPKELLARGIYSVGELWELWESCGRGLGALGAGFVVPVVVGVLQEVRMFNGLKRSEEALWVP